ncbi:hypothetical protein L7F22_057513 [Adiantum nelumboides]|nr:hypothetical protein [Adiantum nelumboides]
MVGAARKDEEKEEVAPPPTSIAAACAASILPRRILFHPPLRVPPPSSSSSLTPLNVPTPDQVASQHPNRDRPPSLHPNSSSPSSHSSQTLPSTLVKRIGAGLNNLGNTCFLNSVLQCLTYTPPLATYFQAGLHKSSCRAVAFCAMCALENHVKQALSAPGRVISPNQLVRNLRCISRAFHMGRQEDAHEYMRYLIEALQKCCPLDVHAKASPHSQKNYIQKIFGGRLQSQVKCTECEHSSNTYDPFLDLSLDIVKAESLLKALTRFTGIEVLDGDNKYFCSKCKKKVRAHKQFTIDYAPHVLTVQFKRFSSSGGFGGKIDKNVRFDRTLNLTPFVNGKEGQVSYSLYAVLVHSGWSTHSGHYFCFVRTFADIWHRLDDCRVSQVSEKIVFEQKAYILFYIRDSKISSIANAKHLLPFANGNHTLRDSEILSTANGKHILPFVNGNHTSSSANGNHHKGAQPKADMRQTNSVGAKVETNGGNIHVAATDSGSNQGDSTSNNAVRVHSRGLFTADIIDRSNDGAEAKTVGLLGSGGLENAPLSPRTLSKSCKPTLAGEIGKDHQATCANGVMVNGHTHTSKDAVQSKKEKSAPSVVTAEAHPPNGSKLFQIPKANGIDVPRWEDREHNEGTVMKERKILGEELAYCGHILDEWDEEYDRGKRKKVRSRLPLHQELMEVSEHMCKKRKEPGHSGASISKEGCDNLFQALAGKRVDIEESVNLLSVLMLLDIYFW